MRALRNAQRTIRAISALIMLLTLTACLPLAAQVQWAEPKIPPEVAEVLGNRGQLAFVEEHFDRVAYYPWPGFKTKDEKGAIGLGEVLGNGDRVAHVATLGRTNEEIADILVDQATKTPHRPPKKEQHVPSPSKEEHSLYLDYWPWVLGAFLAYLLIIVIIGGAMGSASPPATKTTVSSCETITIETTGTALPAVYSKSPGSKSAISDGLPAVLGTERMVNDLQQIRSASWLTRGLTRDAMIREVGDQGSVLEAYKNFFAKANELLKARCDLEHTLRFGQERLDAECAELEARKAKAILEKVRFEEAIKNAKGGKLRGLPGDREDYEI